jgi:uncharacterized protein (DUF433 family)
VYYPAAPLRPADGTSETDPIVGALVYWLWIMAPELLRRISIEEGKCGGRPCIRGFRIRVTDILALLGEGASIDEILADYDFLEREDILAAIQYAAHQADHPVLLAS